jgi:hypothetical protein
MKRIVIKPFHSAGEFILNETRKIIFPEIDFKLRNTREETSGINQFIIDDYVEALAYYNQLNDKLFYVLFAPLPTYELIFQEQNLFKLNNGELFNFLKKFDDSLFVEDYVGFGSAKFGIDVYAPDFTENKSSTVEAVSFAIKGYFDSIYESKELNINKLQNI